MKTLKLFTFCCYFGKNTYEELNRMLFVLVASLDRFHPDFLLVVYNNLDLSFDDPRILCRRWGSGGGGGGGGRDLTLMSDGCAGNVWVEGSTVRNTWHKLSFNKIHVFKELYDEYDGECFTWIDLDTIVTADLSYLVDVDNYFVIHGGASRDRSHDVLCDGRSDGRVLWSIPEWMYIQGSFWKLNLPLYHEVLRLDAMFREAGVRLKYDLQSIFAVMAWGEVPRGVPRGVRLPTTEGSLRDIIPSVIFDGGGANNGANTRMSELAECWHSRHGETERVSLNIIGYNFRPDVMNGLGVWDNTMAVGNHVNTDSLSQFYWTGVPPGVPPPNDGPERTTVSEGAVNIDRRLKSTADCKGNNNNNGMGIFRTSLYPDKEIHILSLTFDSFFMSNVAGSEHYKQLFPFLVV